MKEDSPRDTIFAHAISFKAVYTVQIGSRGGGLLVVVALQRFALHGYRYTLACIKAVCFIDKKAVDVDGQVCNRSGMT
jgi:hypothetical protein